MSFGQQDKQEKVMFGFKSKDKQRVGQSRVNDKARVELIRERLSDHVSTGERTAFIIPEGDDLNDNGEYEFTVTNIACVNYDVTEFEDLTEANTDLRLALAEVAAEKTSFGDDNSTLNLDTDYWSTRS
jgi:hypothetical protein